MVIRYPIHTMFYEEGLMLLKLFPHTNTHRVFKLWKAGRLSKESFPNEVLNHTLLSTMDLLRAVSVRQHLSKGGTRDQSLELRLDNTKAKHFLKKFHFSSKISMFITVLHLKSLKECKIFVLTSHKHKCFQYILNKYILIKIE